MLVLALEFSRASTARAAPATPSRRVNADRWPVGAHGAGGRLRREPTDGRHHQGQPMGRSLKTEERGPTPSAGAGARAGRAPCPEGPGGGPASAGVRMTTSSQCSTWEWPALMDRHRLLRKEVIQPHLPVRLPCYDFTPITNPTFDGSLQKGWATGFGCCRLSWCDGRCVQGPGTYSPRRC